MGQKKIGSKKYGSKKSLGQKNVWVKKMFGSKKHLRQKNVWVKKNGLNNFWVKKNFRVNKKFWVKNFLGKQIFWLKKCWVKKIRSEKLGRVNLRGRIYDPPPQIIVGLKLCWVVVSYACWPCLQNFRPLGSLFLVEVEFVWWVGWGGGCKGIIVSNPTRLRLGCGWVVVRLGFWQLPILRRGKRELLQLWKRAKIFP